jgi:hypothetical protein
MLHVLSQYNRLKSCNFQHPSILVLLVFHKNGLPEVVYLFNMCQRTDYRGLTLADAVASTSKSLNDRHFGMVEAAW